MIVKDAQWIVQYNQCKWKCDHVLQEWMPYSINNATLLICWGRVQLRNPDLGGKLALGQGLLSVTRKTMSPTTTSQGFSPATACQVSQRRQMGNAKIVFPPFEPQVPESLEDLAWKGLWKMDCSMAGTSWFEFLKWQRAQHVNVIQLVLRILKSSALTASGAVIRSCLRDNRLEEAITLMKAWTAGGETIFKRYCIAEVSASVSFCTFCD